MEFGLKNTYLHAHVHFGNFTESSLRIHVIFPDCTVLYHKKLLLIESLQNESKYINTEYPKSYFIWTLTGIGSIDWEVLHLALRNYC